MVDIPKAAIEAAASDIRRSAEWYAEASPEDIAEEVIRAALPHMDGCAAGFAAGQEAMREAAAQCQPSTAENPNEDEHQRGRFDGVMEFSKALRALPIAPAQSAWRPISEAPKDGTEFFLLQLKYHETGANRYLWPCFWDAQDWCIRCGTNLKSYPVQRDYGKEFFLTLPAPPASEKEPADAQR